MTEVVKNAETTPEETTEADASTEDSDDQANSEQTNTEQTTTDDPGLSASQRARIERNRQRALLLRQSRLQAHPYATDALGYLFKFRVEQCFFHAALQFLVLCH